MRSVAAPDCSLTFVLRACDDEERIGHVVQRVASHLRAQRQRFELLVVDEGSGDNTVAIATLLKPVVPELTVLHAEPGWGLHDGCQRARGRVVVLADARSDAPLGPLGYALGRLEEGLDVVGVGERYLVFRRTRAWRAFDALVSRRDWATLERRFVRRTSQLGLACTVTQQRRGSLWPWARLVAAFAK